MPQRVSVVSRPSCHATGRDPRIPHTNNELDGHVPDVVVVDVEKRGGRLSVYMGVYSPCTNLGIDPRVGILAGFAGQTLSTLRCG